MELLKYKTKNTFLWALSLSIIFPFAVAMIPLGFVFKIYAVGVIGIILTLISFYGMPLLWTSYSILKYYARLSREIKTNKIRSIKALSSVHKKKIKNIEDDINTCIQKGYFEDIVFFDDIIIDKSEMTEKEFKVLEAHNNGTLKVTQCPNCHAQIQMINGIAECNYCGSIVSEKSEN